MKLSESDPTLNPEWQAEQMDRLLGFEILTRTLHATYQPLEPELLADKIGANKGYPFKILQNIKRRLNEPAKQD
jgi:hypothetical protein